MEKWPISLCTETCYGFGYGWNCNCNICILKIDLSNKLLENFWIKHIKSIIIHIAQLEFDFLQLNIYSQYESVSFDVFYTFISTIYSINVIICKLKIFFITIISFLQFILCHKYTLIQNIYQLFIHRSNLKF